LYGSGILIHDGDCGFCGAAAGFARRLGLRADIEPWQALDLVALGATVDRAKQAVLWRSADGTIRAGAPAVASVLREIGGWWRLLGVVLSVPPVSWLAARSTARAVPAPGTSRAAGECSRRRRTAACGTC